MTATEDLMEFAKEYVEEAGGSMDEVEVTKAVTLQSLLDLTGYSCLRTERSKLGYEIFEYQAPEEGEKVLLMLDVMTGNWISVR